MKRDGRSASIAGDVRERWASTVAAVLAGLALSVGGVGVASAQVAQIDGNPLDVFADGTGRLQFRFDGRTDGVFFPPNSTPGDAGLEIRLGATHYGLGSGATVAAPTLTNVAPGTQALHSEYTIGSGPDLRVSEDVTYTDGTQSVGVRYVITNVSDSTRDFSAGELADLFAAGSDDGAGIHEVGPPEFIGGVSENGAVTGLEEVTPWTHFQSGAYGLVFQNFADTSLNDAADPSSVDNGTGAQWDFGGVQTGESQIISVTWRVGDTAAPIPTPTPTPIPPPPPPPPPQLAPPVAGKDVNVVPKSGKVLVKLRGTNKFVELVAGQKIPLGAEIDTRKGRVTLTSAADKNGTPQTADFYDGIFRIGQTSGAKPITELTLTEKLSCPQAKKSSASAAKTKTRKLWGDGKGKFRTKGQYSSATVRGTKWHVEDRCDRTVTKVEIGAVNVRDNVKRKTVLIRARKQYIARAKRR